MSANWTRRSAIQARRKKVVFYGEYDSSASESESGTGDGAQNLSEVISERAESDYSYEEDESTPAIQSIVGVKEEEEGVENSVEKYYVKWADKSYIHCSYLTLEEVLETKGGENALKKFKKRVDEDELSRSSSVPNLLTTSQDELNTNWFKIDRVIAKKDTSFLIKWKSLPYDQASWEEEEDIKKTPENEIVIQKYYERRKHHNPKTYDRSQLSTIRKPFTPITETISNDLGNTLRRYQIDGLNWLRFCWYEDRNSILADEMGLGKTVQIVSALNDIATTYQITGPFMIIAPLSTLPHWRNEIEKWTKLNVIVYHGPPAAREMIEKYEFPAYDEQGELIPSEVCFDILITNYETFATDFEKLKEIEWRYLVLDEGHRLKNHAGKCYQLLMGLTFEHCTLLTGTPIQNNVEELWSLLHLLHPTLFDDLNTFLERYNSIKSVETLQELQGVIQPFILRRKKGDVETSLAAKEETIVEVELTRIQKTYYRALLHENASVLLTQITGGSLPSLQNLMMQLRKVCNHPLLIKGAPEQIKLQITEKMGEDADEDDILLRSLIDSSGKMILIDKLLPKLRNDGHKVLIFSQMVKVLDIIEDYLVRKDYTYERIDGSVPESEREESIERFGQDNDIFVFLLCTRAGGVGINLTAADTVIIYDSDWNPQNDVQAQSRCHRIGQKSKVKVYRLVTRGTYELKMLDRASKKLGLDHALLDGGEISKDTPMEAKEIEHLLRYGAYDIAHNDDSEIDSFVDADIDQILERNTKNLTSNELSSVFNKAKFDPEKDALDLNAIDFWSQVLPAVEKKEEEELSKVRRCRTKAQPSVYEQFTDDDESDEINSTSEHGNRKRTSPVSIRGTIRRLLNYGLGDCPYQRAILHQAAFLSDLSKEEQRYICEMLVIEDIKNPPEVISGTTLELCSNLNDVRERKASIVRRCILFYRLGPLLRSLQGEVQSWPPSEMDDPMSDYSILLTIYRKGFSEGASNYEKMIEKADGGKVIGVKALEKKIISLVDALELQVLPAPPDLQIMEPDDWKDAHSNLYNRDALNDDELQILFHTIYGFGLPKTNGKVDWGKLKKLSMFTCASIEAVERAGTEIWEYARLDDPVDAKLSVIHRLGTYGGRQWQRKIRNAIRDMDKIRELVDSLTDDDIPYFKNVKQFDVSDWWNYQHDIALLKAISEYGHLFVVKWVVDPDRPFREHIPAEHIKEFERAAETETARCKQFKPKDAGELGFLFKDKLKMTRALLLVRIIESCRTKRERVDKVSSILGPQASKQAAVLNYRKPKFPITISPHLVLVNSGYFKSNEDTYPIGYQVHTCYINFEAPTEYSWYEGWTEANETNNGITFKVSITLNNKTNVFKGNDPETPWEQIKTKAITKYRELSGQDIQQLPNVPNVSGSDLYGFTNSQIIWYINGMKTNFARAQPIQYMAPVNMAQYQYQYIKYPNGYSYPVQQKYNPVQAQNQPIPSPIFSNNNKPEVKTEKGKDQTNESEQQQQAQQQQQQQLQMLQQQQIYYIPQYMQNPHIPIPQTQFSYQTQYAHVQQMQMQQGINNQMNSKAQSYVQQPMAIVPQIQIQQQSNASHPVQQPQQPQQQQQVIDDIMLPQLSAIQPNQKSQTQEIPKPSLVQAPQASSPKKLPSTFELNKLLSPTKKATESAEETKSKGQTNTIVKSHKFSAQKKQTS